MARAFLAVTGVLRLSAATAAATAAECAPSDYGCLASATQEPGLGLLQRRGVRTHEAEASSAKQSPEPAGEAEHEEPWLPWRQQDGRDVEVKCKVGDQVQCPGSEKVCSGDQCCPGTEETDFRSFPCPSSSPYFGQGACDIAVKIADCAHKPEPCLCTFDVDRTLTGEQDVMKGCPNNVVVDNVPDTAYDGRNVTKNLTLSELGRDICPTFCSDCYVGIVTAGDASGFESKERGLFVELLSECGKLPEKRWSGPSTMGEDRSKCPEPGPNFTMGPHCQYTRANCSSAEVNSTLVVGCEDRTKQFAVQKMLKWLQSDHGVLIKAERVWHFDDRANNVFRFADVGMNARQVSCPSRDWRRKGVVGSCGAEVDDIVDEPGVHVCPGVWEDDDQKIHFDPKRAAAAGASASEASGAGAAAV